MCNLRLNSSINGFLSKIINQIKNNKEIPKEIAPSHVWSNTSKAMAIEGMQPNIIANKQYNKLSNKLLFLNTYRKTIWRTKQIIIRPGKTYS